MGGKRGVGEVEGRKSEGWEGEGLEGEGAGRRRGWGGREK